MKRIKPIRWGIVGTGWVAQHFMSDLRNVKDAVTVAVASRSKDRAEEVADRFQVPNAYGSYEALVQDADVDVVYIATEHHQHAEHCILALRAGKHVLCEKPFAMSQQETARVITVAKEQKCFCMEAMWSRFLPAMLEAKRQIGLGEIGEAATLTADFGLPESDQGTGRFFDPERGGGALLDRGVYPISLATWLFGKPLSITAKAHLHELGTDRTFSALLHFPDNKMANISASLCAYTGNQAVVAGSEGRIVFAEPFYRPEKLIINKMIPGDSAPQSDLQPNSPKERIRRFASKVKGVLPLDILRSKIVYRPVEGYGYGYEAAEVVRCIQEGLLESPTMPLRDTLLVMEIVDKIKEQFSE